MSSLLALRRPSSQPRRRYLVAVVLLAFEFFAGAIVAFVAVCWLRSSRLLQNQLGVLPCVKPGRRRGA